MTDQMIYSVQVNSTDKYPRRWAEYMTITPITAEQAQDKMRDVDDWSNTWTNADNEIDDSDNDSEFDEELFPIRSYDDEEFDEEEEFKNRIVRCLAELERLKTLEGETLQECEPEKIDQYNEFCIDSAQDIRQLRVNFTEKTPLKIKKVYTPLKTKYVESQPYHHKMIIRKKSASLDTVFVVFLHSAGCCSSSDRAKRMFSTQEKAINYAKKLHNFAQDRFYNCHGGHGNESPSWPRIYTFSYNAEQNCFKPNREIANFLNAKRE